MCEEAEWRSEVRRHRAKRSSSPRSRRCLSGTLVSFAGATNDHIITTKRPQHHLYHYDQRSVPVATQTKHHTSSSLIAKAVRQQ
jgi:hypothetical protein